MRTEQVHKLERLRGERSNDEVEKTLRALTSAASSYEGNLMEFAIACARARCTVGEISDALERPWGRYTPSFSTSGGAYYDEYGQGAEEIEQTITMAKDFEEAHGRRPRVSAGRRGVGGSL